MDLPQSYEIGRARGVTQPGCPTPSSPLGTFTISPTSGEETVLKYCFFPLIWGGTLRAELAWGGVLKEKARSALHQLLRLTAPKTLYAAATMPRYVNLDNLQQFTVINILSDPGAIGGKAVIPNCAQIRLEWLTSAGTKAFNILYGAYAGVFQGTPAQCDAIKTTLTSGANWTALNAFFASSSAFVGVSIRDVNTPDQPLISGSTTQVLGAGAGAALPAEVAACISFRTAKSGPANRGRMYVPNWSVDALGAGNVILAGAVTALGTWASSNLLTAINSQGYTPSIGQPARNAYTGSTGTQHPARPAGHTPILGASVKDNHWDSQRRRGLR